MYGITCGLGLSFSVCWSDCCFFRCYRTDWHTAVTNKEAKPAAIVATDLFSLSEEVGQQLFANADFTHDIAIPLLTSLECALSKGRRFFVVLGLDIYQTRSLLKIRLRCKNCMVLLGLSQEKVSTRDSMETKF